MKKLLLLALIISAVIIVSGQDQNNQRGIVKYSIPETLVRDIPDFTETRFIENFDQSGRELPPGWTETHTSTAVPPVKWDFDATPSPPGAYSAPNCLNYNDGTDFNDGNTNSGTVTTPSINIAGMPNVFVSFYYARETEYGFYDRLLIEILRASDNSVIQTIQDYMWPTSTWTPFFFACDENVLLEDDIKIRFDFNTIDEIANSGFGVFIDNITVGSTAMFPYQLYASTGQYGWLLEVDPLTGLGQQIIPVNPDVYGSVTEVEAGYNNILWATTGGGSSTLLKIDLRTEDITVVGTHPFGAINGLEFIGDVLYGGFFEPGSPTTLVTVNTSDASLTTVMTFANDNPVSGLAYRPGWDVLFALMAPYSGGGPSSLYFVNYNSNYYDLVDVCTYPGGQPAYLRGLEFHTDGKLYAGTTNGDLVIVDPSTAVVLPVGPTGAPAISGVTSFNMDRVPLSNWAIVGAIGLILAGIVFRYRKLI